MVRRTALPLLAALTLVLTAACTGNAADADPSAGSTPTHSSTSAAPPSTTATTPTTDDPSEPAEPADPAEPTEPPAADDGGSETTSGHPVLVSAGVFGGNVEMSGYVEGVLQDGGECRFEVVSGGTVVAKVSSTSVADASTTLCPGVSVPAPKSSTSGWTARLVWVPGGATSDAVPVVG